MKSVTKSKRILAVLSIAAVLVLAASCSQKSSAAPAAQQPGVSQAKQALDSQKDLNVSLVAGNFAESLQKIYTDYEKLTGTKVNYSVLGVNNYFQKMVVELSSNTDAYDLIYLMSPQFLQYASNGWLYPVDSLLADKSVTNDSLLDMGNLMTSSVDALRYEGKLYGIPVASLTVLLYYRKDLFQAAGLDPNKPPKTWDEFRDYAIKLHKNGIAGMGMRGARSAGGSEGLIWHWPMVLYSFGGDFVKDFPQDMTPVLNSPEAVKSVEYFADLLKNYSIKGATTGNYEDITVAVQQGDLAMWIDGAAMVRNYIDPDKSKTKEDMVGFVPIPTGPAPGKPGPLNVHSINIPAHSKNKERAWDFIQWSTSQDVLVKMSIEGNLVTVSRKTVYDNPEFKQVNNIGNGAWLAAMNESLANYARAQYRPLTPEWPEVADIVSGYISEVFTGQLSAKAALDRANEEVAKVYKDAGYIK
ncbi:sugar ABC transporter substrate-binding protein [Spirochaetia bacterium]|nr:sugar ABC transporter substrate-binding protein [Spirochaetia bacterium]